MCQQVGNEAVGRSVGGQRQHDDDASGTGCYRECERIEGLLVERLDVRNRSLILFFLLMCVGALLIEQRPSHGGQHEATGHLDDGKRHAKKGEEGRSDEFDNQEKENGIDGDPASQAAIDLGRRCADQAIEDQRRAERIYQRQEGAEGDAQLAPDKADHRVCIFSKILASKGKIYWNGGRPFGPTEVGRHPGWQ